MEFLNTVLHGIKKGLPQMGVQLVSSNLFKHASRLSTPGTTPEAMLDELTRTAKELFPEGIIYDDYQDVSELTSLSTNSCYESNRAEYGALGYAWEHYLGTNHSLRIETGRLFVYDDAPYAFFSLRRVHNTDLYRMLYIPRGNRTEEVRIPEIWLKGELEQDRADSLNWLGNSLEEDVVGGFDVVRNWEKKLLPENMKLYSEEKFNPNCKLNSKAPRFESEGMASVKVILEPLKARLITAGDYLSNGIWGSLQKVLWKGLRKFPCFRLIGQPVTVDDLYDVQNSTPEDWGLWNSGDYSAATDNMKMDTTVELIRALSGDPITAGILMKGLTGNWVDYEALRKDVKNVPDSFEMERGQLMGCIFSFPLLCIANVAVYRHSLELRTGRPWMIKDCPVLVNGDDILFKGDEQLLSTWGEHIGDVGFEKSVGKNYVSSDYCVINSQLFLTRGDRITKVPYLNFGWVTGTTKGGGSMKGNKKRVKTVVPDVRRIRQQIQQTKEDLMEGDELMTVTQVKHRLSLFNRYRQVTLSHNIKEIKSLHLPLDCGEEGLGLVDNVCEDGMSNAFRVFLQKTNKGFDFGTSLPVTDVCPSVLGAWKLEMTFRPKDSLEELAAEFRSAGKRKIATLQSICFGAIRRARSRLIEEFVNRAPDTVGSVLGRTLFAESDGYLYKYLH
jgi:hypothetical protein